MARQAHSNSKQYWHALKNNAVMRAVSDQKGQTDRMRLKQLLLVLRTTINQILYTPLYCVCQGIIYSDQ